MGQGLADVSGARAADAQDIGKLEEASRARAADAHDARVGRTRPLQGQLMLSWPRLLGQGQLIFMMLE